MHKVFLKLALIGFLALTLIACVSENAYKNASNRFYAPRESYFSKVEKMSDIREARRLFNAGYYKRAKCFLLPLACNGNVVAQYALGYMYYYGFGVAQDTDVGYFWIKLSADQGYPPAVRALSTLEIEQAELRKMKKRSKIGLGALRTP